MGMITHENAERLTRAVRSVLRVVSYCDLSKDDPGNIARANSALREVQHIAEKALGEIEIDPQREERGSRSY
jgi:hypothetical protein